MNTRAQLLGIVGAGLVLLAIALALGRGTHPASPPTNEGTEPPEQMRDDTAGPVSVLDRGLEPENERRTPPDAAPQAKKVTTAFETPRPAVGRGVDGRIAGRLLVDPWVPTGSIQVTIGWSPSRGAPSFHETSSVAQDGSFARTGITEPTVRVVVRLKNDLWEAFHLDDVPVRKESETQDSRLDPIDLRGMFERLSVTVFDDAGSSRSGARVTLRNPDEPGNEWSRSTVEGRVEFLTRTGPHDIEIDLDGYRRVHLSGAYGDQIVRMAAGIPLRLTLKGEGVRPGRMAVALLETQHRSSLGGMATFQDPWQATLAVPEPGRYEIAWYLDNGRIQNYLGFGPVRWVDVGDRDDQELVLEVPEAFRVAIR